MTAVVCMRVAGEYRFFFSFFFDSTHVNTIEMTENGNWLSIKFDFFQFEGNVKVMREE